MISASWAFGFDLPGFILFQMRIFFSSILFFISALQFGQCISKIAFGSCGSQDHPLPIYNVIVKHQPELFIFLGDNIYGDSKNMDTISARYQRLARKPGFQKLKQTCPIIATWDDHDYGWNDIGRHWPYKKQSKEIFLEFFNEPQNSERRKREGIYTSYMYECEGKKLQVILLDVRTFRDDLLKANGQMSRDGKYKLDYLPYTKSDSTLLGAAQWKWLEEELKKPADLRIIGSGSQFGIEYNGYEAWANFPKEQKKMLNLIKTTKANGVLFITGDVHYAEISKLNEPMLYPIYDVTSSGLSSTWHFATPNKNRIGGPVMENHFGMLTINWKEKDPSIKIEIWDVSDKQRVEKVIKLGELKMK
jgi:alkaline phosphatase D